MPRQDHPLPYRDLVARLKPFGVSERRSGHSVVRKFVGYVEGRKQVFPLHVHSEGMEVARHYVRAIRDRFKISAEMFYAE